MNRFITYCCLALLSFNSFGQNTNTYIDSLLNVVKLTDNLSDKASAHSRLAWAFINRDLAVAEAYLDSSYTLYKDLKDEKGIAVSQYKYGVLYRVSGEYEKSLNFMDHYYEYAKAQKDTYNIANSLYQKGVVHSLRGDYENSLETYLKTLSLYEALNDSSSIGFTRNSIGIVYKNLEKYDEAIEQYEVAIAIHEKTNDLNNLANAYNNLAAVYSAQLDYDKAMMYFRKCLDINLQTKNNWGIAFANREIGTIFLKRETYEEAISYLEKAQEIQQANNFKSELPETLYKLGLAYRALGNYTRSKSYLNQAFQNSVPSKKVNKELHFEAYQLYNAMADSKQALHHYKEYTVYKDSIFNEDNLKNINALEIQYETEKKDKEIVQQQLLLEQNASELQKKKTQYNYMAGLIIFLLAVSLLTWIVFSQRQKRKDQELITIKRESQLRTLESLIEGEEKERSRIAKELHDGVNGDLSAIKYKLISLQELNNSVIDETVKMIDNSCAQVRAISHNLIPPSLENFNLIEAAKIYCENLNAIHEQEINFHFIGDTTNLTKKEEVNIFRIIQELMSNSVKHAKASEINVQISNRGRSMQITVEDNGQGFNPDRITSDGIGLKNVKSRVAYLNGEIDIDSNKNGSSIMIEIENKV